MTRLVIFDCDGTLIDSEGIANHIMATTLGGYGVTMTREEVHKRFVGMNIANIKQLVKTENGIDLPPSFDAIVLQSTLDSFEKSLQPVPGITEVLGRIQLPKAVASNSRRERLEASLKITHLDGFFSEKAIYSADDVERGKPEPDLFWHIAEQHGVKPSECVVIEDSVPGVEAGRRAGMVVFGFIGTAADPVHQRTLLEEAGADLVFDDMRHLPRLLRA